MTPGDAGGDVTTPAVELDGVSVSLSGVSVLSTVSLAVESGTFLGLIGPNGAGKTTLLRTVNGILDPGAGTVAVAGEDIHALSSATASRVVATVPQDTTLSFDFSVREVVAMGRHPHRDRLGRDSAATGGDPVETAMERVDVARFADRSVTEISGGERRRVLLARALAQDTPVLLLDEPTASLDVNHQVRTLELVSDLVADGTTVIAAIHDLDLAARYCDELALLSGGAIAAHGSPATVLDDDALGDAFDTSIVRSRDQVTGAPSVTALPDPDPDRGETVHVVAGNGSGAGVLHELVGAGFDVSLGVIREGDPDAAVAAQLGCEVVSVPPFSPIESALGRTRERARAADASLLVDVAIGPENAANLDVLAAAGNPVLIEDRPFSERNHVGASARERYEALRERARITDLEDLVEAVAAACGSEPVTRGHDDACEDAVDATADAEGGRADAVDTTADARSR
ncbi:MAG: ATP-binding cassette domain-containing protein [Halobacteriales archaeon]